MSQSESVKQPPPSERKGGDPRYCKTHAFVSEMFAHAATSQAIANAWAFNAVAWGELTELRARIEREKAKPRWYEIPQD